VSQVVHHADGSVEQIDPPAGGPKGADRVAGGLAEAGVATDRSATRRVPLGTFVHARSGDKGGDANLGLWVSADGPDTLVARRAAWLLGLVTPEVIRGLLPEAAGLEVEVFRLPNLRGVNVLIHGLLGQGVAASSRFDPQAKGLGEWVRSRSVDVPEELL
jgi:hypothetical protein